MTKAEAVQLDVLERAATSAGEQFLAVLLATGTILSIIGLPWGPALATAAGAFVVSFLASELQIAAGLGTLAYWPDLAVRVGKAFGASLLATLGAGVVDVTTVPWVTALNVAAVAALLALVKGLLAHDGPTSASLLSHETLAIARAAA